MSAETAQRELLHPASAQFSGDAPALDSRPAGFHSSSGRRPGHRALAFRNHLHLAEKALDEVGALAAIQLVASAKQSDSKHARLVLCPGTQQRDQAPINAVPLLHSLK